MKMEKSWKVGGDIMYTRFIKFLLKRISNASGHCGSGEEGGNIGHCG